MGSPDAEVIVAVVALFISLVALSATFMQVLQQIYASAAGYAKCSTKVMGDWAKSKTRRFSWEELRFEVEFDAPVLFVCPPNNKNGPIKEETIYFLDGTPKSLEETWTDSNMDTREEYAGKTPKERVHTADNERASWSMLLSAVHRMEDESRSWQQAQYDDRGPPQGHLETRGLPAAPPSLNTHHTLCVALQRKRKSWDTMPPTILRPYATTAMCHLIEMMAALGVYWKEFDRKHDRYRAEGNGFMVLGERISDLGLMFSFQVIGKCTFKQKRVIPVDEVKELCFGYVPTIYRETLDQRRLDFPNAEPYDLSSLQMASRSEIAESLVLIGCNNNTVHYFLDSGKRTSHLFSVSFEILGMLSRTFHIDNSVFTYLPNPTPDRWDKRAVSLVEILNAYQALSWVALSLEEKDTPIMKRIWRHTRDIIKYKDGTNRERLCFLKALHHALDDCDEVLTAKSNQSRQETPGRPSIHRRDKTADKLPKESPETYRQKDRRQKVQDVLRSHIQAILEFLNPREEHFSDTQSLQTSRPPSPTTVPPRVPIVPRPPPPQLEDLDAASPDDKQHTLMEVYFDVIRVKVVERANRSKNRRESVRESVHVASPTTLGAPPGFGFRRSGTGRTHASSIRERDPETTFVPAMPTTPQENGNTNGKDKDQDVSPTKSELPPLPEISLASLANDDVSHNDIWCTLVFRMICWLMLHDFDKLDVQVNKSELLGSRMPVYIA